MVDLYTYNFAYLGTRAFGNDGDTFMIAGPGWNGATPAGVTSVIHSETQFAYIIPPARKFVDRADLPTWNQIQAGYKAQTLSAFLKQPTPATAAAVRWPKIGELPTGADISPMSNLLFQFCPPNKSEKDLLARFAKINVGPDQTFDIAKFSPEIQQAIHDGIQDSSGDLSTVMKKINADQISSGEMFGTRDFLRTTTSTATPAPSSGFTAIPNRTLSISA